MSMAVTLHSAEVVGLNGEIIDIETDLSPGLFHFSIVGLADKAVEESKERISAAMRNLGFKSPQQKNQRVVVSLAPADLKKEGPGFDLAIALSYLWASRQVKFDPRGKLFLGELALDGRMRAMRGVLALALAAKAGGFREIFLPRQNTGEASLVRGLVIYGAQSLSEVIRHLEGEHIILKAPPSQLEPKTSLGIDFEIIKGQEIAKRGLEIAAAGGHHVLMVGPPGAGKTLLARALPSILPPLSFEEILEATKIHSIAGTLQSDYLLERPFRNPHHTASYVALVGGGQVPRPGEITLAHRGVLFLDEFPEFERRVMEALRQPLEDGMITVARAKGTLTFPARSLVVFAMNPCPCGNYGSERKLCLCSGQILSRYQRKISGPLADRIDIWLEVPQFELEKMGTASRRGESEALRRRIARAREIQKERFTNKTILLNSEMGLKELEEFAPLDRNTREFFEQVAQKLNLSARAYHRVLKLSRTIADLEEEKDISKPRLLEALQYRARKGFLVHET